MCDSATAARINDVVTEYVNQSRLFTAFEVSLEVKRRMSAAGEPVAQQGFHSSIKRDVHNALQAYTSAGLYCTALQNVGAPSPALVYYPQGANPGTYIPLQRSDTPKVAVATAPVLPTLAMVPVTLPTATAVTTTGGDGKPDARGTLCVSNSFLRLAGLNPKDRANVSSRQAGGTIELIVTKNVVGTPLAVYTVDAYNNVRITRATLDAAGVGADGATYDFSCSGDEVVIRQHV